MSLSFKFLNIFCILLAFLNLAWQTSYQNGMAKCKRRINQCSFHRTGSYIVREKYEIFVCKDFTQDFHLTHEEACSCKHTNFSNTRVYFRLTRPLVIDESLQLANIYTRLLIPLNSEFGIQFIPQNNNVLIKNSKGFDINSTFQVNLTQFLFVNFHGGRLEFFLNETKISTCRDLLSINITSPKSLFQTVFIKSKRGNAIFRLMELDFRNPVCPIFFSNSNINVLYFRHMTHTFYRSNFLRFEKNYDEFELNSDIQGFEIEKMEKIKLDSSLLHPGIFKNVKTISLLGAIASIEPNIFKPFTQLTELKLESVFFIKFIHKNGLAWMRSINYGLDVKVSNYTDISLNIGKTCFVSLNFHELVKTDLKLAYSFPDEDFCLWQSYPFRQLVITYPYRYDFKHTCTLDWLEKDLKTYLDHSKFKYSNNFLVFLSSYFVSKKLTNKSCDFERMINNCNKYHYHHYKIPFDLADTKEALIFSEFIFMLLLPFVSLLGLATNLLIIVTISIKDTRKFLKAKQYQYIRINSVFNVIFLLLNFFSWLSECQTHAGIYCSPIRHLLAIQYFRIIGVEFFSSVFRLASNFAYFGFSINRLSLIGKKHGKVVIFFSELSIVKFTFVCLIISVGLSIPKAFHLQANKVDANIFEQHYPLVYERNFNNILKYRSVEISKLLNITNAISDISNYLLFILVNLILDIILIVKLKKTLSERINVDKKANDKIVDRTVRLVVNYAIVGILLKIPSSIKSVYDAIHVDYVYLASSNSSRLQIFYENVCVYARLCMMFEHLAHVLFTGSLVTGIFFYYFFDRMFAISLKICKSRLSSTKEAHRKFMSSIEESFTF